MNKGVLAIFGLIKTGVSDNSRQFGCSVFKEFRIYNRIDRIQIPIYHPHSNSTLEERTQSNLILSCQLTE